VIFEPVLFCIPNTNVFVEVPTLGLEVDIAPAVPIIWSGIDVNNIGLLAPV
jgi:hypothetical protein